MAATLPVTDDHPLRISAAAFRARQKAGENAIILDVRNERQWAEGDGKLPGALRAFPELPVDPDWAKDRLILTY